MSLLPGRSHSSILVAFHIYSYTKILFLQFHCLEGSQHDEDLLELSKLDQLQKGAESTAKDKDIAIKVRAKVEKSLKEAVVTRAEFASKLQKARDATGDMKISLWVVEGERDRLQNEGGTIQKERDEAKVVALETETDIECKYQYINHLAIMLEPHSTLSLSRLLTRSNRYRKISKWSFPPPTVALLSCRGY